MKRTVIFTVLLCVLLLLALGCERKVTNTILKDKDFTGADACMECHGDNDLAFEVAQVQWARSKHGIGETTGENRFADPADTTCERCHTAEGFLGLVTNTPVDTTHFSPIGCFTCHAPHTTGTLALRVTDPYTLKDGDVFDHGEGNLCVNCHHGRRDVRTYVADSVKLSERFGPHHSNQGDMLNGSGGYEYDGYTYSNSPHSNVAADGCINCHMASSQSASLGGHTWTMESESGEQELAGCNNPTCHSPALEDFDYDGMQTTTLEYLDSLGEALYDAGLADYAIEELEDGTVDTSYAPMVDKIVKSKDSTGALYNYLFIKEDRSEGVHNTEYALDLLQSALNFIRTGDPNGAPGTGSPVTGLYSAH
jgi:hypothetical protein